MNRRVTEGAAGAEARQDEASMTQEDAMPGRVVAISVIAILVLSLVGAVAGISGIGARVPRAAQPAAVAAHGEQPAPAAQSKTDARVSLESAPSATPASGGMVEVTVTATELKLTPAEITAEAGQTVRLTFANQGAIEHDWEVTGVKSDVTLVAGATKALSPKLAQQQQSKLQQGIPYVAAGAGDQATIAFTAPAAGTYDLACMVPGHKEGGMKGKLIVGGGGQVATAPAARPAPAAASLPPAKEGVTRLPAPTMAPPLNRTEPAHVTVDLETNEVVAQMADGVTTTYWTFNGAVPGPMLRVMEGDTITVNLSNAADSAVAHSIDFHAATGPGGGAAATQTAPGGRTSFTWQAINPGVYVYHCATPMVAHHIANGMYGLIVVEPKGGLPAVDQEFYVMQGEFYLQGARTAQGHREFDAEKMLDERPDFVVFNGSVGALTGEGALRATVGETVRIYFGVGGPNLTSSFHVIGEVFDRVYAEGATGEPARNVQTTLVPTGGATMVEFTVDVPGRYVLVDHSLGRLEKGSAGFLEVEGPANPDVFKVNQAGADSGGH